METIFTVSNFIGIICAKKNSCAKDQFEEDSESEHDAHTGVGESRVERSDEPSYLVNIDPATATRGGGGGWRHESAGVAERASEAGRYDANGERGPRRSSRGLALVGPRGRRRNGERDTDRRGEGENPCEESTEDTNDTGIRSHEETCSLLA